MSRYPRLAEVVRFSAINDDQKSEGWSPAAEKIIANAPEPAKVLGIFLDRFSPRSWSGSRADIMASRLPMIEKLSQHPRSEVVDWGKKIAPEFAQMIERERAHETRRDRSRDERFE